MEYKKYNPKKIKSTENIKESVINSKYKLVNEQAYTEDGILIYNLKGYTKNTKDILEEISKYFQNYGKNVKVSLLSKQNYLIEFSNHKEAANCLKQTEHFISNYVLYVEPCSSCFQPDIKNFMKYLDPKMHEVLNTHIDENNYLTESPENNCLISKLNDDCLMEICKNFNIEDEMNFALCCRRFCGIIQMISSVKYLNFNMNVLTTLSCFQIKIVGSIIGSYIKVLTFNDLKFAKLFCTHCRNVETLKIDLVVLEQDLLTFFNEQMPNIKKLDLKIIAWNNEAFNYLKLFKNLRSLNINSIDVTGVYISCLDQLTELCLHHCNYIDPQYFKDICENLRNLQYLDIRNCWYLTTKNSENILENLIKLETLKFTNTKENFNCICRLPQLKFLEINLGDYIELSNDFLRELVKYKANQLLELKIDSIKLNLQQISLISELVNLKVLHCYSNEMLNDECLQKLSTLTKLQDINFNNCTGFSDESILKLMENCLELKKLNLVGCQLSLSDFIRNAVELLKNQHVKYLRTNRVNIIVEYIDLSRYVAKHNLQVSNDILKVTFEQNHKYDYLYNESRLSSRSGSRTFCGFSRCNRLRQYHPDPWDVDLLSDLE